MSKESKTGKKAAQAAAAMNMKEKKVIPDAQLAKLYRDDRAQGLWPGLQTSDALLREYDKVQLLLAQEIANVVVGNTALQCAAVEIEALKEHIVALSKQLLVAEKTIAEFVAKEVANADIASRAPYADELRQEHDVIMREILGH